MEPMYDDSIEALEKITGIESSHFDNDSILIQKAKLAREYLMQLSQEGASRDELNAFAAELVTELDAECPYLNKPVHVTGRIFRPTQAINSDSEVITTFIEDDVQDLLVVSHGFVARYEQNYYSIGHKFALVEDRFDSEDNSTRQTSIPQGYAEIDDATITYEHDSKEAQRTLESLAANFIDTIDEALFNADSLTDIFHELAEIKPYDLYKDVPSEVLMDSAVYVGEALSFDASVPYEIEFKSSYLQLEGPDEYVIHVPDNSKEDGGSKRIFGYIQAVEFTNDRAIEGNRCTISEGPHFALAIKVVHDEVKGGATEYEIQVLMKDITQCESLRELLRTS